MAMMTHSRAGCTSFPSTASLHLLHAPSVSNLFLLVELGKVGPCLAVFKSCSKSRLRGFSLLWLDLQTKVEHTWQKRQLQWAKSLRRWNSLPTRPPHPPPQPQGTVKKMKMVCMVA